MQLTRVVILFIATGIVVSRYFVVLTTSMIDLAVSIVKQCEVAHEYMHSFNKGLWLGSCKVPTFHHPWADESRKGRKLESNTKP